MGFLRLSNPAICVVCGKILRKGRVAFWEMGTMTCLRCMRSSRGDAPIDPEEGDLLAEIRAEEEEDYKGKGRK